MPVQLPATLTMREARTVAEALATQARATPAGGALDVDAGALASFDTSALAALLQAARAARQAGAAVRILRPPTQLVQLAALYGVADLLGLPQGPASPLPQPSAA